MRALSWIACAVSITRILPTATAAFIAPSSVHTLAPLGLAASQHCVRHPRTGAMGIRCMAGAGGNGGEEDMAAMLAKLKSGMNSWSDDAEGSLPAKKGGKPGQAGKQKKQKGSVMPPPGTADKAKARVRVEETRAGRGGKTCTVVTGLEGLPTVEAKALLKKLKAKALSMCAPSPTFTERGSP